MRELWDRFKAWNRGEKRVAPRGARGRVYARIKPARVYRAATDTWHDVDPQTGKVL